MEFKRFNQDLKYLAGNGVTLNVEERMNVGIAIATLGQEIQFEELYFWGKIEGKSLTFKHFITVKV